MVKKLCGILFFSLLYIQDMLYSMHDNKFKAVITKDVNSNQKPIKFLNGDEKSQTPFFIATNKIFLMYSAEKSK